MTQESCFVISNAFLSGEISEGNAHRDCKAYEEHIRALRLKAEAWLQQAKGCVDCASHAGAFLVNLACVYDWTSL